jgi:hypothetical protein
VSLVNPVAPIDVFLTDRGYLADLFSPPEIDALRRSVSPIRWRQPRAYVRSDQQTLYVTVDDAGRELLFRDRNRRLPVLRAARWDAPVPQRQRAAAVARLRRPQPRP